MTKVLVDGIAAGRIFKFECDLVSRDAKQATFTTKTNPTHKIQVTPRYVESNIGSDDTGTGQTVCAFAFDGSYCALAMYKEEKDLIKIIPQDY